jgi:DNA-binding transcriptional MerR regulator
MALAEEALTLAELAERTGISERTIRYYIQFGLLPGPEGAGPSSRYSRSHLGRLRVIRMLQDRLLPLNAIRKVLAQHSDKEIEKLAEEPAARSRSSALDYVQSLLRPGMEKPSASLRLPPEALDQRGVAQEARSHWERISIAPDIELHVRRPLSKPDNRRLEELLRRVRELFPGGNAQ